MQMVFRKCWINFHYLRIVSRGKRGCIVYANGKVFGGLILSSFFLLLSSRRYFLEVLRSVHHLSPQPRRKETT